MLFIWLGIFPITIQLNFRRCKGPMPRIDPFRDKFFIFCDRNLSITIFCFQYLHAFLSFICIASFECFKFENIARKNSKHKKLQIINRLAAMITFDVNSSNSVSTSTNQVWYWSLSIQKLVVEMGKNCTYESFWYFLK